MCHHNFHCLSSCSSAWYDLHDELPAGWYQLLQAHATEQRHGRLHTRCYEHGTYRSIMLFYGSALLKKTHAKIYVIFYGIKTRLENLCLSMWILTWHLVNKTGPCFTRCWYTHVPLTDTAGLRCVCGCRHKILAVWFLSFAISKDLICIYFEPLNRMCNSVLFCFRLTTGMCWVSWVSVSRLTNLSSGLPFSLWWHTSSW